MNFKCYIITHNVGEESITSKKGNKDIIAYKSNENLQISWRRNNKYSNSKRKLIPSKKNLILGAVANYRWEIVQPFFKSFEAVGFENCDCVIFVKKLSESTIKNIESFGVIVKYFPKEYENMITNKIRYKMYLDFLNENKDKYNLILHVDIRDSIFQQDIFQFYDNKKPFLEIAIEDGFLSEKYNKQWFIYAFGEELFKKVENERIICSGTILGTPDKFLQVISQIWEKVKDGCYNLKIHDQTMLNYIIYIEKNFDDCLIKTENKDGKILTLALGRNISLDSEDNVLSKNGEIAPLVHQYDRLRYIWEKVRKKFCIEGRVNLTKKYTKKYIKKEKSFYKKRFLFIFLLFALMIIIFGFYKLRPLSKRKIKKYGYKRYKDKKYKKSKKYNVYKFTF